MESPINANEHESKHWDLGHDIMGAFYGMYHELGHGSPEAVYEEALGIGLREAGCTVARHVATPIWFRGRVIGEYKADLVVNGAVLLKLKAPKRVKAQILNYRRAKDIAVGLLLSFGSRAQFQRFVIENNRKGIRGHSREFAAEK